MRDLIESIQKRDPAQPTFWEVALGYPGFHALALFHPVASWLWQAKFRAGARAWANIGRMVTGIEIHPQASLGKNLFIDHGTGVVIGQTGSIGDDCTIYHGVTLGGKGSGAKRHPSVGHRVSIGAHAQLIGPITIGDDAVIGAGAVVVKDVPPGVTVAGNPARPLSSG